MLATGAASSSVFLGLRCLDPQPQRQIGAVPMHLDHAQLAAVLALGTLSFGLEDVADGDARFGCGLHPDDRDTVDLLQGGRGFAAETQTDRYLLTAALDRDAGVFVHGLHHVEFLVRRRRPLAEVHAWLNQNLPAVIHGAVHTQRLHRLPDDSGLRHQFHTQQQLAVPLEGSPVTRLRLRIGGADAHGTGREGRPRCGLAVGESNGMVRRYVSQ